MCFKIVSPKPKKPETPKTSVVIFADVQYADSDTKQYGVYFTRNYRKSADCLQKMVDYCDVYSGASSQDSENSTSPSHPKIESFINLGDFMDRKCITNSQDFPRRDAAFKKLSGILSSSKYFKQPLHCIGNHEYENFSVSEMKEKFFGGNFLSSQAADSEGRPTSPNPSLDFLDRSLAYKTNLISNPRIKVIHIDNFDISLQRENDDYEKYSQAYDILNSKGNRRSGLDSRFVGYTGGASQDQLNWLQETLSFYNNDENTDFIILRVELMKFFFAFQKNDILTFSAASFSLEFSAAKY